MQLSFVKLVVRDLDVAEAFYSRAFGLQQVGNFQTADAEETMLRGKGGLTLVLYRWKDGRAATVGTAHGPIGFTVADVDAAYDHAVSCGAVGTRPPADYGPTARAAFVNDPDGHEVEMVRMG